MKNVLYIAWVVMFWQCHPEKNSLDKPERLMSQSEFANLLYDMNLLEGSISNFNFNMKMMSDTALSLYQGVFVKNGISYEDYVANQEYYILSNSMKEVSEIVLERVMEESKKYEGLEPIKSLSFVQLTQLFDTDGLTHFVEKDTQTTFHERMDSLLRFYRNHQDKLANFVIDSLSFETNIIKLKKGKDIFREPALFFNNKRNE